MKKIVVFVVLAAILATGTVFADHPEGWGVGVVGGGGWDGVGGGGNAALSLKVPGIPVFWSIELGFPADGINLGVAGDFYLIDDNLIDSLLGWYFGIGAFVGFGLYEGGYFNVGARLPVGLSLQFPVSSLTLEFFLSFVPRLGFESDDSPLYFRIGGEAGLRVWF